MDVPHPRPRAYHSVRGRNGANQARPSATAPSCTIVFIFGMLYAYYGSRLKAANNPWGAGATTLEWDLPSPPAFHSYETLPTLKETAHH